VVWHPRGKPPRPELAAALSRPGMREVRCGDPYSALAHLATRAGPSALKEGETGVLVLVDPDHLPELMNLMDAVDRYVPAAAVWCYDPAGSPALRAVTADDMARWRTLTEPPRPAAQAPAPRAPGSASGGPRPLRLAGSGTLPPEQTPPGDSGVPHPNPDVKAARPDSVPPSPVPQPSSTPAQPSQPSPTASPITPLLTQEELAMLLSGDAEERR
jgi:hypothetical protein